MIPATEMTSPTLMRLSLFCYMCNHLHVGQQCICQDCYELFVPIGPACQRCARPLSDSGLVCGYCLSVPQALDNVYTAFRFEGPLRQLLHDFKYNEKLNLTKLLVTMMHHALDSTYTTECIIPIPMHRKRLRQRGYNQAAILAKEISKRLNIPYNTNCCKKIIHTAAQAGLKKTQRELNLKHAFACKPLHYKHVTLIDDLITTGSTANAVARELKNSGVDRVDLLCVARAL